MRGPLILFFIYLLGGTPAISNEFYTRNVMGGFITCDTPQLLMVLYRTRTSPPGCQTFGVINRYVQIELRGIETINASPMFQIIIAETRIMIRGELQTKFLYMTAPVYETLNLPFPGEVSVS